MPHFNDDDDDDEHGCAIEEDGTDTIIDATIDDDGLRRTKAK